MMKTFFLLSPKFLEWPLALMQELAERHPDFSAMGLVTGPQWVYDKVKNFEPVNVDPLDNFRKMELSWVKSDADPDRIAWYEKKLGTETLNQLIVADRHLGYGYIKGANPPKTELSGFVEDIDNMKKYIVCLLDHILERLERYRPNLIFCYTVAGAPAYALYAISNMLDIPFRRFALTRIGDRQLITENIVNWFPPVAETFEQHDGPLERYVHEARNLITEFRQNPTQPDYSIRIKKQYEQSRKFHVFGKDMARETLAAGRSMVIKPEENLRKVDGSTALKKKWEWHRNRRRDMKNVDFETLQNIIDRPYIYYPLHFEPEASTMVLAPNYTDQACLVERISKSMPMGMDLFVKDHIPMIGKRPRDFYERLSQLRGVRLIHPLEDPYRLIQHSSLVCTITGTAAWEAFMLKKPVMVFGDVPFSCVGKGVFRADSVQNLVQAIQKALIMELPKDEDIARYISAVLAHSFDLPTQYLWSNISKDFVQSKRSVLMKICDELENSAKVTVKV